MCIHTPGPAGFFFFCTPPPPFPPGNSSLASCFASKILTFKTPLPLGISADFPWGWVWIFSGTHNVSQQWYVVDSCPYSIRFFSGYASFSLTSKTNISKFQLHVQPVDLENNPN